MINNPKKGYDCASTLKDILERKQIIDNYHLTGYLDRDQAIKKIVELRQTDAEVAAVTSARLVVSSTPFSSVSNQGIIAELQMQIDILSAKSIYNSTADFQLHIFQGDWFQSNCNRQSGQGYP